MKWIKRIGILCSCCIITVLLASCGAEQEKKENPLLFEYNGSKVYMDEAWIYAKTIQGQYEAWYGSSVWEYEIEDDNGKQTTMEDITKKDMIQQIKMVKVLSNKAKEEGITLTEEEEQKIETDVASFMGTVSKRELEQTGISENTVRTVYQENMLSDKMYDTIKEKAKITVTEEECRQYRTYHLFFETLEYDQNGKMVEYDTEKKAEQKERAQKAYEKIQAGETNLAKLAEEMQAYQSSEYLYGKDEEGAEAYIRAIQSLEKGEISEIVETKWGYHIIKVLDTKDPEATKRKKQELIGKEQNEYFREQYDKMTKPLEEKWKFAKAVKKEPYEQIQFKQESSASATGNN